MEVKEARPLTSLSNDGEPTTATVHDSVFFKYVIQDASDVERLFLLLNVSNRKRLSVYINRKNYPSQSTEEHAYAVGDIPEDILKSVFKMHYMKELLEDANPF